MFVRCRHINFGTRIFFVCDKKKKTLFRPIEYHRARLLIKFYNRLDWNVRMIHTGVIIIKYRYDNATARFEGTKDVITDYREYCNVYNNIAS